jgi:hypothetical protein
MGRIEFAFDRAGRMIDESDSPIASIGEMGRIGFVYNLPEES